MGTFGETWVKHSGKLLRHFAPKCTDLHFRIISRNHPEPPETAVFPAISHNLQSGAGGDGCGNVGTLCLGGVGEVILHLRNFWGNKFLFVGGDWSTFVGDTLGE